MTEPCHPGTSLDDLLGGDGPLVSIVNGSDDLPYDQLLLTSSKCIAAGQVIRVNQRQQANLTLQVRDVNGTPIDLNPTMEGESSSGPALPVVFTAKETHTGRRLRVAEWCEVQTGHLGIVKLSLTRANTEKAGMFYAQLVVLNDDKDTAQAVTNYWLEIAPSLGQSTRGPLTIAEIRMELKDVCGAQNMLLGDVEFSDDEITHAIFKPIEEFNETYAPTTNFTTVNFPFRFNWRRATTGYLLQTIGWHYERNNLRYKAGDVSVDDKDKFATYNKEAVRVLNEWREFIAHKKLEMNARNAWGSLSSPLR
jgi:hypothetical protein